MEMKKPMRLIGLILFLSILSVSARDNVGKLDSKDVKVYYFHATARCVTCQAVETVTKEAIKEYYGDKILFTAIDREKEKGNPLIKKYKISGQTLLIVNGDKVVNLTTDAFFSNALTKTEMLKEKVKFTIDSMLEQ